MDKAVRGWHGGGRVFLLLIQVSFRKFFLPSLLGRLPDLTPLRFPAPAWLLQNPKGGRTAEKVLRGNIVHEFLQKVNSEKRSRTRLLTALTAQFIPHGGPLEKPPQAPGASDLPGVNIDL